MPVKIEHGQVVEVSKISQMVLTNPTTADFEKMKVETLHDVLRHLNLKIAKSARKSNIIQQIITNWDTMIATRASSSASASTNEEKAEQEKEVIEKVAKVYSKSGIVVFNSDGAVESVNEQELGDYMTNPEWTEADSKALALLEALNQDALGLDTDRLNVLREKKKAWEEKNTKVEDYEGSDDETYTSLVSYLDFVEHPDTYTPEWEHYLNSPEDFFANPAKIDIREFKGQKLMTVPIDLGNTTAMDVKETIVGVIERLSADHPMRQTLGVDNFRLLCCCVRLDDDYVIKSTDDPLVIELRLRGGGFVRQSIVSKKKKDERLDGMKMKIQSLTSSATSMKGLIVNTTFDKCHATLKALCGETGTTLEELVNQLDRKSIDRFYELVDDGEGGQIKLQDISVARVSPAFLPVMDELDESIEKYVGYKRALAEAFRFIYGTACLKDNNRYDHNYIFSLVDARAKTLDAEDEIERKVQERVATVS